MSEYGLLSYPVMAIIKQSLTCLVKSNNVENGENEKNCYDTLYGFIWMLMWIGLASRIDLDYCYNRLYVFLVASVGQHIVFLMDLAERWS